MNTPKRKLIPVRNLTTFSEKPTTRRSSLDDSRHSKRLSTPLKTRNRRKYRLSPYSPSARATTTPAEKSQMTQYTLGKSASFANESMLQLQSLMDAYEPLPTVVEVQEEEEDWDVDIRPPVQSVLVDAFENVKI